MARKTSQPMHGIKIIGPGFWGAILDSLLGYEEKGGTPQNYGIDPGKKTDDRKPGRGGLWF
jgi:hypothetical protein